MFLSMCATDVISTMMHKMIRDALLFPAPLQAYYPLTVTVTEFMREKKTPLGKERLYVSMHFD